MNPLQDIDNTSRLYKIFSDLFREGSGKIIYTGVVLKVYAYGGDSVEKGRRLPPGTLKVKIPELDATNDINELNFYEPLLPIHMMAMPEINEEVIVMFDSIFRIKGYWISRNDSMKVNKSLINSFMDKDVPNSQRIGSDITDNGKDYDFEEGDVKPDASKKIPAFRKKPGDVYQIGRSNTEIIHTFNIDNKEGILDITAGRSGNVDSESNDFTYVKEREFEDAKSRIMLTIDHNIDKNLDWDLTAKPGFSGANSHSSGSYILLKTGEFRFVSDKSQDKLNNAVLGNKLENWLKELLQIISNFVKIVSQQNIVVVPQPIGATNVTNLMTPSLNTIVSKLNSLESKIKEHHSKVNFLN